MGGFLQSTETTPCGHLLKWMLTPENPPVDTMFMAAMAMVLPWKLVEHFQSSVKNTKRWPSLKKSVSCKKMGLKSSFWFCLKACFKSYTFCFTMFLSDHLLEHSKAMNKAQKHSNDLERSKFCQPSSKFHSCASLNRCYLQISGNA